MFVPKTCAALVSVILLVLPGVALAQSSDMDACANAAEESQGLRKEGKLTQARDKLLVCARSSCPAFIQKDCATWLVDVEKNLPSIVVRAVDTKGKDIATVRVTVDGKLLTEKLDGRPLSVDPGEHVFVYESPGLPSVKETSLIRQGESNRLLSVTFPTPEKASSPASPEVSRPKSGSIPLASWILGGAGVALVGVGTVFWITGRSDHDSLESGCAKTQSCRQDDVDSAKSKLLVGDVAFGAGLVAIGAAVVLALVTKTPAPTAWRTIGPGRVGFAY